jgi:hypothetical protein
LFGPAVRAFVLDTLFKTGHSTEVAAALRTAATEDAGPKGRRAPGDRAGDRNPDNRRDALNFKNY